MSSPRKSTDLRVSVHTDGASKGNPGPSGCGAVLRLPNKTLRFAKGLKPGTNNVAEYEGVLLGLESAIKLGATHVRVYSDSEVVVKQINGVYATKNPDLAALCAKARHLKMQIPHCVFSHIFREDNMSADVMANKGVTLGVGEVQEVVE